MNFEKLTETQLIEEAKKNASAFAFIYRRYVKNIYNYFFYKTFIKQEAEDLTSQTFEKVLLKIKDFHLKEKTSLTVQGTFKAWIFKIAHNLLIDYYRKQKEIKNLNEIEIAIDSDLVYDFIKEERDIRLKREIRRLPMIQQEVIHFKYQEGLSNQEIGGILGKSEGAIKQLAFRALAELRDKIKK